jgi:prolyl-tRNA editing enzyme YbaK/EbsC (Cys-tRNA(Pro) deacylase)
VYRRVVNGLSTAREYLTTVLHPTAAKVQQRLRERGLDVQVRELAESTRTAAEAAAAVGVETGQIVKSLVFTSATGEPVLVLCAGDRRVDTDALGDGVRTATADEVRAATGFAIGGVPPLGHDRPLHTVVDESLRRFDSLWCAAGTPRSVFRVRTDELLAAIPDVSVRQVSAGG